MLQLLRLLLYLAAGAVLNVPSAQSTFFESAPSCGYSATGFVNFKQSPELLKDPSLGVCGVGFDGKRSAVNTCASCTFTPAEQPACGRDATVVQEPIWYLAPQQDCRQQGVLLSQDLCTNGTEEESTALSEDGTRIRSCCPFKRYVRCCTSVNCISRSSPAGQCVDGEKDLLPGQQVVTHLFAASKASTNCSLYLFNSSRLCRANRTFAPAIASCELQRAVSRDSEGCVKLPGYVFHRGVRINDSPSWRIDDGTPWDKLENAAAAQQAAARDMLLMASRCSALDTCAGFQNTGVSADLLYQLPTPSNWSNMEQSDDTRCYGVYEKSPPKSSCPRISDYLFIPLLTLDTSAVTNFKPSSATLPCSTCSNSSALASQCNDDNACVGFSNYHGLLTRNSTSADLLSDAPMTKFTTTPCVGMFIHTVDVPEVEDLDRLLCGDLVYCSATQLRYHASVQSSTSGRYVDLTVDILTDLTLPRGLQDATGGGLRSLPTVRSLSFRCLNGSGILGGLPVGLTALTPILQELRVQGCRTTGFLPAQLSQLRFLRLLDFSENALTGSLPNAWGNMTLGYLNLSYNALTGTLPKSWRGIITSQAAATPPPPLPRQQAGRRLVAQATAAAVSGLLVADLRANKLDGPVDRGYVYDSCVRKDLRMQLQSDPSGEMAANSGQPTFLLQYNRGIAAWAGRYVMADLSSSSGRSNLCGAHGYKIALGVLWGVFGMCFLAICMWSSFMAWTAAREARRGRFFITDASGAAQGHVSASADAGGTEGADADAGTCGGCGAAAGSLAARTAAAASQLWRKRWVRRVTLLARVGYLVADMALDIRVMVWLFNDGDGNSAGVCLAFMVATQAVVSAAVVASVSHNLFSSRLLVAILSPLLVALGPVVGPVLAVANIRNSDVPLVFWRYLELVEFCVALLQAPAESVTQSVVYARLNQLGNGMYMDHALFLASIILSLGDILIAAVKLCRYKRGPLRRVLVALTHLDRVRDPVDYQKPLLSSDFGNGGVGSGGVDYVSHYLDAPLNPPADRQGQINKTEAGPLPISPPRGGGAAATDEATTAVEISPGDQLSPVDEGRVATAAHTFTPLTAPRYRPSMLAASSQRLGGGAHSVGAPSRLGPGRSANPSTSTQLPLWPSHAYLPVTPMATAPEAGGQSGASSSAEAEAAMADQRQVAAAAASGSLNRRSHSPQTALPMQSLTSQNLLAGSISSDAYGSAATGGHGPPPMAATTLAPAPKTQKMARSASDSGADASAPDESSAATAAAAAAAAAIAALPPPFPSTDPRYLPSAVAVVKAGLADFMPAPLPAPSTSRPASAVVPPERLILGPPLRSTSMSASGEAAEAGAPAPGGARSLRHVPSLAPSSRSAQGSPARRREGPVLSIAVPASPVHALGIEVIRMSTPSSARHLSPQTSRGAPTPVGMLPPPPPQQLQLLLQQERLERQQQHWQEQQPEQQQHAEQEQEPRGGSVPLPPSGPAPG